jgi:alpha-1,6-mannosyltransferase
VHPPFLSTDIYRYVWDGKVQAAGINPFRYIPADPHLAFLRDAQIYPHINRRSYAHTIYPPGSQIFFLLVDRLHASVLFMKSALLACEAVTCAALIRCLTLLGQPRERVLLYAWQPVCIWEIGSSGHIDALAVTAIALALMARLQGRPRGAMAWLGAATLVKLYPIVLFPAFLRRRIVGPLLLLGGIVVAGYLPYLSVGRGVFGFLPEYAKEEGIDSGVRFFPLDVIDRAFHISIPSGAYIRRMRRSHGCARPVGVARRRQPAGLRGDRAGAGHRTDAVLLASLPLVFSLAAAVPHPVAVAACVLPGHRRHLLVINKVRRAARDFPDEYTVVWRLLSVAGA